MALLAEAKSCVVGCRMAKSCSVGQGIIWSGAARNCEVLSC